MSLDLLYKTVSTFINALSFSFKLPQIQKIIKNKSSKGLSPFSNYLDFYSILYQGLYGVHKNMSAFIYLENFFTTIQNIIIIFLSWYYSETKATNKLIIWRLFYCVSTPLIIIASLYHNGNWIPEHIWTILALIGMPSMAMSRIVQMRKIQQDKNVGSVSLSSFVLRAAKNFIKILLIMYEKMNYQLILNQLSLGIFTTGVIVFYFKYKDYPDKKKEDEHKVKTK